MLKIAIIDDNFQYRITLAIILQLNEKFKLIHKLESCDQVVANFTMEKPDVVLMDIDMPGISGIQGVWEIKKLWPEIKVLMLTVFEDDIKIFGAIKAGANGYLLKKDSPEKIHEALVAVSRGESPMNGMIASKVLDYFQQQQAKQTSLHESHITEREKEILALLIKGLSYKEIAAKIFVSIETLNTHVKNIYRKLNVHSRSELSAKYGPAY